MASVASFFISRIDSRSTPSWTTELKTAKDAGEQEQLKSLLGKVAIANGKQTYQKLSRNLQRTARWKALAAKGAQTQRVLWASTSTKNPEVPRRALRRGVDRAGHGQHHPSRHLRRLPRSRKAAPSLTEDLRGAQQDDGDRWPKLGISMKEVTDKLTDDGVKLFAEAFDKLLEAVEKSSKSRMSAKVSRQPTNCPRPWRQR